MYLRIYKIQHKIKHKDTFNIERISEKMEVKDE